MIFNSKGGGGGIGEYIWAKYQKDTRLPAGYTRLTSISSSGSQYINSNVPLTTDLGVKAKFRIISVSQLDTMFGVHDTNSPSSFFAIRYGDGALQAEWGNSQTTTIEPSLTVPFDCEIEFNYLNSGKLIVNGVDYGSVAINRGSSYTLHLFSTVLSGIAQRFAKIQLESFVITTGQVVVRDYVPCTNASEAAGLYDLITGAFYPNNGSGEFTKGDEYLNFIEFVSSNDASKYPDNAEHTDGYYYVAVTDPYYAKQEWEKEFGQNSPKIASGTVTASDATVTVSGLSFAPTNVVLARNNTYTGELWTAINSTGYGFNNSSQGTSVTLSLTLTSDGFSIYKSGSVTRPQRSYFWVAWRE